MSDDKKGGLGGILGGLMKDPAVQELTKNAKEYATKRAGTAATGWVERASGGKSQEDKGPVTSDKDKDDSPTTAAGGAMKGVTETLQEGGSPLKAAGSAIKGAVKGGLKRKGGSANKRPTNITDEYWIGLPAKDVYSQWTEYKAFPGYMKGPTNVSVDDDYIESSWKAKIFLNNRSWKAKTVEMIPDQRIKWTTESNKGSIDGVITFHEVADRLTLMIFVLEYRPKGFFEWWGNRWRTVGRRYRLDVKHFRRFLMMAGETVPEDAGFRGRIEGGEVQESDEDARNREQDEQDQQEQADQAEPTDETDETDETEDADVGELEGDEEAPAEEEGGPDGEADGDAEAEAADADAEAPPEDAEAVDEPEPVVDSDDRPESESKPEPEESESRSSQREARRARRRG